ncbi:hypothetical protein, partial [Polaribacter sp.]|uniref:hypothetical protein n=1 Tax=Polaribacter sp. TaxID=1920175 RepID=UPI003F6AB3F1
MNYLIREKEFSSPESINCKYYLVDRDANKIDVLMVSFTGNYPDGSLGKNHAKFISRKTISGLIEFDPDAVILDFRALEYNWGNNILEVFEYIYLLKDAENSAEEPSFPIIILVSDLSKNGMVSVLNPIGTQETSNLIFDDEEKAIKKAIKKG